MPLSLTSKGLEPSYDPSSPSLSEGMSSEPLQESEYPCLRQGQTQHETRYRARSAGLILIFTRLFFMSSSIWYSLHTFCVISLHRSMIFVSCAASLAFFVAL